MFREMRRCALVAWLAAVLCLVCVFSAPIWGVTANAEETSPLLEISVSVNPTELSAPGDVTLTFTLTNISDVDLESVSLATTSGLVLDPIGSLAAGESQIFIRMHTVDQEELDAGVLNYIITCLDGSTQYNYPVEIPIQKNTTEPEVEFLRRVSSNYVTDSGSITVVYEVRNTGSVSISNLAITDSLNGFSADLDTLNAGESQVFIQHVSLTEDAVSAPILTYSVSSEVYTQQLDDLYLYTAQGGLDAEITAGRSMFSSDTAEVILTLSNSGDLDYEDLIIYDDIYGGIIADSIRLPAGGEDVDISHTYALRGDSSYRWRIVGTNSAGDQIDFVTDTIYVYSDFDTGTPSLTLTASTTMTRISRKGYISVLLEVENVGDGMAVSAVLSEESEGELTTLTVVPLGEATVYEYLCEITESTTLVYTVTYTDRNGETQTASAEPLEITIGSGGETPLSSSGSNSLFSGLSMQIGSSSVFIWMLIVSILVLIALTVALIITSRRARLARKAHSAERRRRRENAGGPLRRTSKRAKPAKKKASGDRKGKPKLQKRDKAQKKSKAAPKKKEKKQKEAENEDANE